MDASKKQGLNELKGPWQIGVQLKKEVIVLFHRLNDLEMAEDYSHPLNLFRNGIWINGRSNILDSTKLRFKGKFVFTLYSRVHVKIKMTDH